MKQNLIIILLTAAVILLAVNIFQGKYPPPAQAASGRSEWTTCQTPACFAINSAGEAYMINFRGIKHLGKAVPGVKFSPL